MLAGGSGQWEDGRVGTTPQKPNGLAYHPRLVASPLGRAVVIMVIASPAASANLSASLAGVVNPFLFKVTPAVEVFHEGVGVLCEWMQRNEVEGEIWWMWIFLSLVISKPQLCDCQRLSYTSQGSQWTDYYVTNYQHHKYALFYQTATYCQVSFHPHYQSHSETNEFNWWISHPIHAILLTPLSWWKSTRTFSLMQDSNLIFHRSKRQLQNWEQKPFTKRNQTLDFIVVISSDE